MGFFSFFKILFTPQSFKTGEKFEHYIRKKLFTERYFQLVEKTYGYGNKGVNYVKSVNPDFKFFDRRTKRFFFIEAKYRKSFYKGQLSWCTEKQLEHYHQCNRETPVFIVLGVGGEPWRPAFVALIPLYKVNFTTLYLSFAEKYKIHPRRSVLSKILWKK